MFGEVLHSRIATPMASYYMWFSAFDGQTKENKHPFASRNLFFQIEGLVTTTLISLSGFYFEPQKLGDSRPHVVQVEIGCYDNLATH